MAFSPNVFPFTLNAAYTGRVNTVTWTAYTSSNVFLASGAGSSSVTELPAGSGNYLIAIPNWNPTSLGYIEMEETISTIYDLQRFSPFIGPGTIDIPTLTPNLASVLLSSYFITTGTTTPASADIWYVAGVYSNKIRYYASELTNLFAWNNGSGWTISSTVGVNGSAYWSTAAGATVTGPYTAYGTATGVPVVASHGNSTLSAFQPDVPFPAHFGNMQINISGYVGPDFNNINQAGSATTLLNVTVPNVTNVATVTNVTNVANVTNVVPGLAASGQASLVTAIMTDATPSNQTVPGSLGFMTSVTNDSFTVFTVTDTNPSASTFVITLSNGASFPGATGFPSNLVKLISGVNKSSTELAGSFSVTSSTIARVTFATSFAASPANGDIGIIF